MPLIGSVAIRSGICYAYEELDVSTSVVTLTKTINLNTVGVYIRFEAGALRYRVDGGNPSATVGLPAEDLDTLELNRHEARDFKVIQDTGPGKIRVSYYRRSRTRE